MTQASRTPVAQTAVLLVVLAVLTLPVPSPADGLEERFNGSFPPDG